MLQLDTDKLRSRLKLRLFASTAVVSAMLVSPPSLPIQAQLPGNSISLVSTYDLRQHITDQLQKLLPTDVEPLTENQETRISELLRETFGLNAFAKLNGEKLNTSYGLIGAEQHLKRFPGDTLEQHGQFLQEGMAPGLGAWGYINDPEKEKYYVAVQTLYLPDWELRLNYLRDWYKYRKVAVVNPNNGKVIIAVVGDAGPARWTGKHFGGSPEIMAYLNLNWGKQKGPVVMFFVDDPDNKIPLGPLEYNLLKGPPLLSYGT